MLAALPPWLRAAVDEVGAELRGPPFDLPPAAAAIVRMDAGFALWVGDDAALPPRAVTVLGPVLPSSRLILAWFGPVAAWGAIRSDAHAVHVRALLSAAVSGRSGQ